MTATALFIKHKTLPGKRAEVEAVWRKHMALAVQENAGPLAYFYCFDDDDPDAICAFLSNTRYASYLLEVEPLSVRCTRAGRDARLLPIDRSSKSPFACYNARKILVRAAAYRRT